MNKTDTEPTSENRYWFIYPRSQTGRWGFQILFWIAVIFGVLYIILFLSDIVVCYLSDCDLRWQYLGAILLLLFIALLFFVPAYASVDKTEGAVAGKLDDSLRRKMSSLGEIGHKISNWFSHGQEPPVVAPDAQQVHRQAIPQLTTPQFIIESAVNIDNDAVDARTLEEDKKKQTEDAKKLNNRVNTLQKDIAALDHNDRIDLAEYRQQFAKFRFRYDKLTQDAKSLPLEIWNSRQGATNLQNIKKILAQFERYLTLAEDAEPLQIEARKGDDNAAKRIYAIYDELIDAHQPFDLEPAKSPAKELAKQLLATWQFHQSHFIEPVNGVFNDTTLVNGLEKLDRIRKLDGDRVKVRFYIFKEGMNNDTKKLVQDEMPLSEAYSYALTLLTAYREERFTIKNDEFNGISTDLDNNSIDRNTAIRRLQKLINDTNEWPDSLPGWAEYPETGPSSFPNKVDKLREELNGKINVLKAELDDQPTSPPGPTDRAASAENA